MKKLAFAALLCISAVPLAAGDETPRLAPTPAAPWAAKDVYIPDSSDYILEPPDVVDVTVVNKEPHDVHRIRSVVAPDGRISLGSYGNLFVAGMAQAEAEAAAQKKVAKLHPDCAVTVTLRESNSKVAYVIFQGLGRDANSDNVVRAKLPYPLTNETNVGSLLRNTPLPNPVDFDQVKAWISRPAPNGDGVESKLAVELNNSGQPTPDTNHAIQPGDRLFVNVRNSAPVVAPLAYPVTDYPMVADGPAPAPMSYGAPQGLRVASPSSSLPVPGTDQVAFSISVVEDTSGSFREFAGLREHGVMTASGETLRGTLAILKKNKLAKAISAPTIVTAVDRPATIAIGEETVERKMRGPAGEARTVTSTRPEQAYAVRPSMADGKLRVVLSVELTHDGRRLQVRNNHSELAAGESLVLRFNDEPVPTPPTSTAAPPNPMYVIVTPTLGQLSPTPVTPASYYPPLSPVPYPAQ